MKKNLIILLSVGAILLTGCNDSKEKDIRILELEKQNLELKHSMLEQKEEKTFNSSKTEKFHPVRDAQKIDLSSITVFTDPKSVNYDMHDKLLNGVDIVINNTVLCDDIEAYVVNIQAPESVNINRSNIGYSNKRPISDKNKGASFIYNKYCLNNMN
jgi:hypothetical protein